MAMHNSTEEEQISELKEFVQKYWKLITAILVLGLLAVWGQRYWTSHSHEQLEQSSMTFEALVAKLDPKETKSVQPLVTFAQSEDNIYGVFAALKSAQYYVEELKDYAGAQALLTQAATKTKEEPILATINTRIARLQYQQGQFAESLQTLDTVKSKSWAAVVNDIRGDNLVKQQHYADAISAYQSALVAGAAPELIDNVSMKLNEAQYLQAKQELANKAQHSESQTKPEVVTPNAQTSATEQRDDATAH